MSTLPVYPQTLAEGYPEFTPCYIFQSELSKYNLPSVACQANIMQLVMTASSLIDEVCGRVDADGNGSLAFTTYTHIQPISNRTRNLIQTPVKPLVAVSQTQISGALSALAASGSSGNCYYTGCLPNTVLDTNGQLSALIGISGRYGYPRQDFAVGYPDFFSVLNPLTLLTIFGGPAPWTPIDPSQVNIDYKTGTLWVPAGLQLQSYSDFLVVYNTGFDPLNMHPTIKMATAMVVQNMLQRPTTGTTSVNFSGVGMSMSFTPDMIDPTITRMLSFCTNTIMI